MKNCIHVSDGFMDDAQIHRLLPYCDGILPLTDGNTRYRNGAVSGAFNLAYGYHLPLISGLREQPPIAEIDDITLVPTAPENLSDLLRKLAHDSRDLQHLRASMQQDPRWSFTESQHSYLSGINLIQPEIPDIEITRRGKITLSTRAVLSDAPAH